MPESEYLVEFGCVEDHIEVKTHLRKINASFHEAEEEWIARATENYRAAEGMYLAIRTAEGEDLDSMVRGHGWDVAVRDQRPARSFPAS